jgi:hypothetical protein
MPDCAASCLCILQAFLPSELLSGSSQSLAGLSLLGEGRIVLPRAIEQSSELGRAGTRQPPMH